METIILRPAMSLLDVEARSGLRLDLKGRRDDSSIVIERRLAVRYAGPAGALEFPPTLMLWIDQLGGTVLDFELTPQLEALDLPAARALAWDTAQRVRAAGWQQVPGTREWPSANDLAVAYLGTARHTLFARKVGSWALQTVMLDITLKQLLTEGTDVAEPLEKAKFLVQVHVGDAGLRPALLRQVRDRRRLLGKDENEPIPLSVWVGER